MKVSLLVESNATHMYLLLSSTSRRKYFLPPGVVSVIGPHKSPLTRSSKPSTRHFVCDEKELLFSLVVMQSAQSW
jgi:hypothetical protein